jgi:hypothetical protein
MLAPMKPPTVKLVLDPRADGALLAALAHFPVRAQSQVLASWLQDGYRVLCGQRPSAIFVPAVSGGCVRASAVRRVHYRNPSLPGLALLLQSLNQRERGQEIRRLISLALRRQASRASSPASSPAFFPPPAPG